MAGNNEFINTFQNGMNRDNNVVFQPEGTYTFLKNLQLVSHDGNNITLKDALGNREIILLDVPFASNFPTYQTEVMAIGFISFPDRLIVLHTNNESSTGGGGEIGQIFLTNIGQSVDAEDKIILSQTFEGYVPLYYHENLNFSKMYKTEGFGFPENDDTNRIYWTDNYNEPRVFNVTNPIFTDYIPTGSLIIGKTYMVLSGIVNYNGTDYGKGLTTTNIFTATTAGGVFYTPVFGKILVIEYFPYELLSWTPSRLLGNMVFNSYGTGVKRCGSHMYFYRLGKRSEGYFTSWSYGCYPIHIGVDNDASLLGSNAYQNFVGNGSSTTIVVSNKSIKIDVSNLDLNFDVIQLACAEYDQLYTTPYAISIVNESTITGTDMTLEDFGNVNLGNLTLDDVTLFPASILRCKTITTNKNYNIIGNITERAELDFDKSTVTISSFEYPMPVHGDDQSCNNGYVYDNVAPTFPAANTTNPAAGSIIPWSRWLVTFGNLTTDTVSYNGNNYVTGDIITGVSSAAGVNAQNTITFTGSATARPASYLRKYTSSSSVDVNDANLLRTISWDYKDPLLASTHRGYWSHELYRFAVLFYDKKGNPFYAQHIADYQLPLIATKNGLMRTDTYLGEDVWAMNPSLINIDGLEISESIASQISGFSIVRAPRDVRIVAQGLTLQNNVVTGNYYPSDCILNNTATIADRVYTWISPDNCLSNFPEKQPLGVAGDIMEEACWVKGVTWGTDPSGDPVTFRSDGGVGGDPHVYAKMFVPQTDPSSIGVLRSQPVLRWQDLGDNQSVVNIFGFAGITYFNGNIPTLANNYTSTMCTSQTGVAPFYVQSNAGRRFIGGQKSIISMQNIAHFNQYPSGTVYTAGSNFQQKIIMNYVKELTNPYGGTSPTALANTLYISTGHFQQIDSTSLSDTRQIKLALTGTSGTFNIGDTVLGLTSGATGTINYVIGTNIYFTTTSGTFVDGENINTSAPATGIISSVSVVYLFNGIQVGGGDCFTCLIDQGYGLQDTVAYPLTGSIGFYFPCECNSNYNLRRGRKASNKGMGGSGGGLSWVPVALEDYSYNAGYSSEGAQFTYPALPVNFVSSGKFPARARFAGQKIIGEIIDSFRTFLTNDYIDVNVQSGEINNVRAKGDYIYYWQNHAVGSMPILERQMISATAGAATTLGTGGVLTRFDIISPKYGNQHQHGLTETVDGWIWFDMRNKDVCVMSLGGGVADITVPLGMKSWFNEIFLERLTDIYNDTYLNSQTYDISSDRPLMGTGIVGVYDPKNKMSYLTFKFISYYKISDDVATYDGYQIISKDFTIGFSHTIKKFIGFYDKTPAIWHNHNQSVLSCNNPKNLNVYYAPDMVLPTPVAIGDVVKCENKEYVCFEAGNAVYSVPPDPTMFVEINKTNQIWIENEEKPYTNSIQGYQYNKLYGRVVNNELEFIITPKAGQMSVTNYEMGAQGDNITDVVITADNNQTASDLNIKPYNRDYAYYDGSWWGNLPISKKMGRITDKYLRFYVKKKNYDVDPTVYNGKLTIFEYFKSFFENKR